MILALALATVAATAAGRGWTLEDAAPTTDARPALVVTTPGVARGAYAPLVHALVQRGLDPQVLRFGCGDEDAAALAEAVVEACASLPADTVVVAHGLGATLALMAAPRLEVARYVLAAPVLGVVPQAAHLALADLEVGASADLSGPWTFQDRDGVEVLLGHPAPTLTCAPAPFAAEVQGWIRAASVPVDLSRVRAPVWLALSQGDDVASVEAVVPAARGLGGPRRVVRLGISRLDRADFDHGTLLTGARVVRLVAREAARRRARRHRSD